MREIGNLGENDIKNKLLVAAAAVSDHGTNNNLCTAASMASANGGHMNNLEGQHLGLHGLTHHGKHTCSDTGRKVSRLDTSRE